MPLGWALGGVIGTLLTSLCFPSLRKMYTVLLGSTFPDRRLGPAIILAPVEPTEASETVNQNKLPST